MAHPSDPGGNRPPRPDPVSNRNTVYTTDTGGNRNMGFIIGAIVVALLVIGFLVFGDGMDGGTDTGNSVDIDNTAPVDGTATDGDTTTAPATGGDTTTAPATGGTTAPATPPATGGTTGD